MVSQLCPLRWSQPTSRRRRASIGRARLSSSCFRVASSKCGSAAAQSHAPSAHVYVFTHTQRILGSIQGDNTPSCPPSHQHDIGPRRCMAHAALCQPSPRAFRRAAT